MMRTNDIDREITELKAKLDAVKGSPTEVYARIVGYYRSVRNWNKGKRQEFSERLNYAFPEDLRAAAVEALSGDGAADVCPDAAGAAEYLLFTRRSCPNCPPVRDAVGKLGIPGSIIDVDSDGGFALASERRVFAAPTVIFLDGAGKELARAYNPRELEGMSFATGTAAGR